MLRLSRLLVSAALALAIVTPLGAAGSAWTPVAEKLRHSIVFLENCTGFSINTEKRYILTAAHCLPDDEKTLLADGTPAYKVYIDNRKDLMVLRAPGVEKPALFLAERNPVIGQEVATFGFGYALLNPLFRASHVSQDKLEIEELSGPYIAVDAAFIPGQSGGPIVDLQGNVVAIVQMGNDSFGFGQGAELMKDRVGRFFEKRP